MVGNEMVGNGMEWRKENKEWIWYLEWNVHNIE